MAKRIRVGDYFAIPLPNGRFGYCQYIQWNEQMGYLVRVLDLNSDQALNSVEHLSGVPNLFPPVFVGLRAAVTSGRWQYIGNARVTDFVFPKFRATSAHEPGVYDNWWIWDGREHQFIGKLSSDLRQLESQVVWGYEPLEQRIVTSENLFADIL